MGRKLLQRSGPKWHLRNCKQFSLFGVGRTCGNIAGDNGNDEAHIDSNNNNNSYHALSVSFVPQTALNALKYELVLFSRQAEVNYYHH